MCHGHEAVAEQQQHHACSTTDTVCIVRTPTASSNNATIPKTQQKPGERTEGSGSPESLDPSKLLVRVLPDPDDRTEPGPDLRPEFAEPGFDDRCLPPGSGAGGRAGCCCCC